jgi:hypothetical protein
MRPRGGAALYHRLATHCKFYIEQISVQSTLILSCRLSGTFLRFFLIVVLLQSLNGTLGIDLY